MKNICLFFRGSASSYLLKEKLGTFKALFKKVEIDRDLQESEGD